MLYELIAAVRPQSIAEVKEIASTAGALILRNDGVIRGLRNWGVLTLPRQVRKHQAIYDHGHYFIMRFDASAATQKLVRQTLDLDPRMVRFSCVRMGSGELVGRHGRSDGGGGLADVGSKIWWREGNEVER